MKNKIAFKLTLYFGATLLLFSIIIGSIFMMLFKNHTMELHKADLESRAIKMSNTLSELIGNSYTGIEMMGDKKGGYGAYLRFLNDIAMTDVWIVDENQELITSGNFANRQYQYSDLPQNAEIVVNEVFNGKITYSEGFSDLLNTPTLTVGTPIQYKGNVVGALLLHSPVEGMNEAIIQGFETLAISMSIALALSIVLSIVLAVSFTKPLKKMKHTAMKLSNGEYSVKTSVRQNDEIGELANSIDILSERLETASKESERLIKLRRDFIANISHELRTPVTVIRGSLEALYDDVVTDPKQVKTYHHQMLNESILLQRLVNDLLDLSRLQNPDFNFEMQELNLCDVIKDVVRSAEHISNKKNIIIKHEQDTQICVVLGDYGRLRQMFLIILDNAIKFSPHNSIVTIAIKDKIVSIKNKGVGIQQQDLPYIFDRFYKVKSEDNKDGTGLGLSIAKQIADRHNITIFVSSSLNEETEFQFKFTKLISGMVI